MPATGLSQITTGTARCLPGSDEAIWRRSTAGELVTGPFCAYMIPGAKIAAQKRPAPNLRFLVKIDIPSPGR